VSGPQPIAGLLAGHPEQLRAVVEEAGRLLERVTLLRVALQRSPDELELTSARLANLAENLRHAVEDGRAAVRSWHSGR
jgi:hypothetical protein